MSTTTTIGRWARRGGVLLGLLGLGLDLGCGANGFGTSSLIGPISRSSTTLDGFVFVPSRSKQNVVGSTIPHALLRVFRLPRTPGDTPVALGQAGADGSYAINGLPLGVSLLVIAEEPFPPVGQPPHELQGVVSFQSEGDTASRNLNENSTLAAATFVQSGSTVPVSEAQEAELEAAAEAFIAANDPVSVTTDPEALEALAELLEATTFGDLRLRLFSTPPVTAAVELNGVAAGSVLTTLPSGAGGELLISNLAVGDVTLNITAPGFVTDSFVANVDGGETNDVDRTLTPVGQPAENQLPIIDEVDVAPDPLPFTGGQVTIRATIRDPENDSIEAAARVVVAGGPARTSPGELIDETDLVREGATDFYSGQVDVPGNAGTANAVYTVVVTARDEEDRPPVQGVGSFSVAGVAPPPPPPSGPSAAERAAFVARLNGDWPVLADGPVGLVEGEDPAVNSLSFGAAARTPTGDGGLTRQAPGGDSQGSYQIVGINGDRAQILVTYSTIAGGTPPGDPRAASVVYLTHGDRTLWLAATANGQASHLMARRNGTGDSSTNACQAAAAGAQGTWEQTAAGPLGQTVPVPPGHQITFTADIVPRLTYPGGARGTWQGQGANGEFQILSVDGPVMQMLFRCESNSGNPDFPDAGMIVATELSVPALGQLNTFGFEPGATFHEVHLVFVPVP